MNLYQLRYFLELAEKRQYTKAARQLNITQPSLSHAMAQLEEELLEEINALGIAPRASAAGPPVWACPSRPPPPTWPACPWR